MRLYAIALLSFFTIFNSCKGQNKATAPEETLKIGATELQLDKTIWTIYQDNKLNYWFGSRANGVYFYNGQLLKQFTTADGLVGNEIRGIQEDASGNVFIETEQGVSKFDGKTFKTVPIKNPDSPSDNWELHPDDLWFKIGFNKNGVYRYDGNSLHFLELSKSPQEDAYIKKNHNASIRPYGLYSIYKDRKGIMWFGTASLGVCRFDGKTLSWHFEEQLQTTPPGGDFGTRAIIEDKESNFWINNTRYRYSNPTNTGDTIAFTKKMWVVNHTKNNAIEFPFFQSVTEDDDGNLWMATYNEGIYKFNGKVMTHFPIIVDGKQALFFSIYKDKQGILWLGSFEYGIFKFNGTTFEKFEKFK